MDDPLKDQLEALLFASGRKLTIDEIMKLIGMNHPELIKEKLALLKQEYEARNSSIMVVEEPDGWKLTTREKYLPIVQKIVPHTELSKSVMETLAVVAWKQPILQSDVIRIRTNKAYEHIAELESMGFLTKQKYGRTYSISLTQKFFDYFDLKDVEAAKAIFKDIKDPEEVEKKAEQPEAVPLPFESVPQQTEKTEEQQKEEVPEDEKEEDVYESKDELLEEDEISPDEQKFMEGYDEAAPNLENKKNTKHKKNEEKEI